MVMSDSELLLGLWAREGRGREEASPAGRLLRLLPALELGQAWGRGSIARLWGWRGGGALRTKPVRDLFQCPYLHRSDSQGDSGTGTRQRLGLL